MDSLYSLLLFNNGKELSEEFVKDACEILISSEKTLRDYIVNYRINNSLASLGEYLNNERIIEINPEEIIKSNGGIHSKYDKKIYTLQIIRHEIEHARSLCKLYSGDEDLESLITRYSLIDYILKNDLDFDLSLDKKNYIVVRTLKMSNYKIDPGERIVEIRSNDFITNFLKEYGFKDSLFVSKVALYNAYIRGYDKQITGTDSPTLNYLTRMNMFKELYDLKRKLKENNYSLDDRLLFGLPITQNEKDNELVKKIGLKRR